jgi:hypothetical protein
MLQALSKSAALIAMRDRLDFETLGLWLMIDTSWSLYSNHYHSRYNSAYLIQPLLLLLNTDC